MKKIILSLILSLSLITNLYAATGEPYYTYPSTGQVTSTNLNGNITTIWNVINSGLDNQNANTSGGYRFYEVLGSLPSAGTEGRMVYLTTNDTLYVDNSSAFTNVGVSKALDNLASVAINTSLISDTTDTDDLGSSSKIWKTGYAGIIHTNTFNPLTNTITFNENGNNPVIEIDNDGTDSALYINQDGVLGSSKWSLYVESTANQAGADLVTFQNSNASTINATLACYQAGSGPALYINTGSIQLAPLTASQYVKTDGSKNLISSASFTAGHYYPKEGNLSAGDAVILINGKVKISQEPKDSRCVGIYMYDLEESRNSITNEKGTMSYIVSLGDSYEWENTLKQALYKRKYKVINKKTKEEKDINNYSKDQYGQPIVGENEKWIPEDILDSNGKRIVESENWQINRKGIGFKCCNEGGKIIVGTYLCTSSIKGFLMAQNDDLLHSYTVGKSMEDVIFDLSGKKEGVYGYLCIH